MPCVLGPPDYERRRPAVRLLQRAFGLLRAFWIRCGCDRLSRTPERATRDIVTKGENMKLATTTNLPKNPSAKGNDPNNPAWTEEMQGAPVRKCGRGPQATSAKVRISVRLDEGFLEYFKSKEAGYQLWIIATPRTEVERNLTCRPTETAHKS